MEIKKTEKGRKKGVDFENLGFGEYFADHMVVADYEGGKWNPPEIVPFGAIEVLPSMCSLHYGQMIFEGLKAFYANGHVNVFRPKQYHDRLIRSCERLCIPPIDFEVFIQGMSELIKLDQEWVPQKKGCSLYIRPFIFATDSFLGVRVADTYKFMIITSPVGAYYKEGLNPVSLMTSEEYVRASKGGLGGAKTPANYAASLLPAEIAKKKGFTQVLWLDGVENRYIEEVGTMNIFFVIDDLLITPPLEGTVLAGITRSSVLYLAEKWGIKAAEKRIAIDEVIAASKDGRLKEVFGTGTAAVISPVGRIHHKETSIIINGSNIGPLSQRFYDEITGIQYGERPDADKWCYTITL